MTASDDHALLSILSTVPSLIQVVLCQTTNIYISSLNIDTSWEPQCLSLVWRTWSFFLLQNSSQEIYKLILRRHVPGTAVAKHLIVWQVKEPLAFGKDMLWSTSSLE